METIILSHFLSLVRNGAKELTNKIPKTCFYFSPYNRCELYFKIVFLIK